MSKVSSSG